MLGVYVEEDIALASASEIVKATGLDVAGWPPDQVRGLFIDAGLVAVLILFVWRFPWQPLIDAVSKGVTSWTDVRRAEADSLRAQAERDEAEAERKAAEAAALDRIKAGRRDNDG